MINANKPHLWKADVASSVDLYNSWFMEFAPQAYRETRVQTTQDVQSALKILDNLRDITPEIIMANPSIVPTLRMCTAPPLARDRLTGLGYLNKSILTSMEDKGTVPPRMKEPELSRNFQAISSVIARLLDKDIFTWIEEGSTPTDEEVYRASTIIADRLCGAVANPIIKNAQERRQLALIASYLEERGYERIKHPSDKHITEMANGTYSFIMNVPIYQSEVANEEVEDEDEGEEGASKVNLAIDVVIKRKDAQDGEYPILIECKSAGDFTNTNKRRKEEAIKNIQLRNTYGTDLRLYLFLCGYFDTPYLGYEAAEGLDWIWEHRISDLEQLGI